MESDKTYRLMLRDNEDGKLYRPFFAPSEFYAEREDLFTMVVLRDRYKYDFMDGIEVVVIDNDGNEIHNYTCYDGTELTF